MDNLQLCRICICSNNVMMSIFGEDALWKKITSFANVHIEKGDSLPQQVCIVCAKDAINACSFKQKCEEADAFFRKQLLRKMELRLPNDTELISLGYGSVDANIRRVENSRNKEYMESLIRKDGNNSLMNQNHDNFPVLMEDICSKSGDQTHWDYNSADDNLDDSLPLIPEIELITPNDEEYHHGVEEYKCNMCFKSFTMESVLKHHIKYFHPERNPKYECVECKKMYLSRRFLEKHIRMGRCVKKRKNSTRPMECSECRTLFPTGHHLGWHKRTGNCRSRSPKLSLMEYEQRSGESDSNDFDNCASSGKVKRRKLNKLKTKGGRTRIKLDSKKIAFATELVKQQVSTTKFAQELKISRTFAWRLRKTIENNLYRDKPTSTTTAGAAGATVMKSNIPIEMETRNIHLKQENTNFVKEQINNFKYMNQDDILQRSKNEIEMNKESINDKSTEIKQEFDNTTSNGKNDEENYYKINPEFSRNENLQVTHNETASLNSKTEKKLKLNKKMKQRKPNVFIDETKYAQAKILIANHTSTMDMAKILDISQMSAWKLRDCILKNIPLSFKKQIPIPKIGNLKTKMKVPRQRLKRDDRIKRDKIIRDEILSMIKEDKNIQYWKVSEILAEKGFSVSASSVCQRLKSMGIHRRQRSSNNDQDGDDTDYDDDDGDDNDDNENDRNDF